MLVEKVIMKVCRFFSVLFCLAALWTVIPCQARAGSPTIESRLNLYTENRGPGLELMIIQNGKVIRKESYGYEDRTKKKRITSSTRFVIGSLSKQFTAMAALILEKQGKLDPEDHITKYLSDLPKYMQDIKVKHLIHHQSGLPDYGKLCSTSQTPVTNREIMEFLKSQSKLDFPAGSKYVYSNAGYVVLSEIISKASGQNFIDFLRTEIFEKVGMKNADVVTIENESRLGLAHSYTSWPFLDLNDHNPCNYKTGPGSVVLNIDDYAKWTTAFSSDAILPREWIEKLYQTADLNSGEHTKYAYGWIIDERNGKKLIWHNGAWLSFVTYSAYLPSTNTWIVFFSNYGAIQDFQLADELITKYQ